LRERFAVAENKYLSGETQKIEKLGNFGKEATNRNVRFF
jgi:hypothetical protein